MATVIISIPRMTIKRQYQAIKMLCLLGEHQLRRHVFQGRVLSTSPSLVQNVNDDKMIESIRTQQPTSHRFYSTTSLFTHCNCKERKQRIPSNCFPKLTKPLLHYNFVCALALTSSSKSNPQNDVSSRMKQRRFYSKNVNTMDGSSGENEMSDNPVADDSIRDDPWVKSLLADMRKDFDEQEKPNSVKTGHVIGEHGLTDSTDYEYDYRYAGGDDDDDVEEFGYFADDDIVEDVKPQKNLPISLNRGVNGVFELEELVALMEHLGANNIVSVPIPPEARYCDHMVIVTAKSSRHLQALNDEMLWVHKRKKSKKDPTLHIEGKDKSEWCAMDIGNVVLHIFQKEELRQYYDMESLWLLGPDKDPKCFEDQHNPQSFALSAEELYWMEVGGGREDGPTTSKGNSPQSSS